MKKFLNEVGSVRNSPLVVIVLTVFGVTFLWYIALQFARIPINLHAHIGLFLIDLIVIAVVFDRLVYFFSQFVLPIQNQKDRQEIYKRVLAFASGKRGPAIFIKNGNIIEHEEERDKKGPGVLLLDTASAAVLKTDIEFGDTVGPGVKFTGVKKSKDKKYKYTEKPSGSADLRTQWKFVGPMAGENVFLNPPSFDTIHPKESVQQQERAQMTSGWTRDGFEVFATLSIKYRIKRSKNQQTESGVMSRYGFDPHNARKALIHEPLELKTQEDKKELLPWDALPEHLVINLWREALGKFKLDELFSAKAEGVSGIQTIERRINKRVQHPGFDPLDDADDPSPFAQGESLEYKQLLERGIEIMEVKLYNIQLHPDSEEKVASQWSGEWLKKEKREALLLDEKEASNETKLSGDAVRLFARIATKHFNDSRAGRPDNFALLQKLIEPLIETASARVPADDEQKALLHKLNAVWKWLVANKPAS